MAIGAEIGVAYVSVIPSARDFAANLRKQIAGLPTQSIPVGIRVDTKAAASALKALSAPTVPVGVSVDTKATTSKLHSQLGDQSALGTKMGDSAGSSMASSLTSTLAKVVATLGGLRLGKEAFSVAADFETTEVAFTGLLGSADEAQKRLAELQQFAAVTPFDFPGLADAAKKLLAFGFSADSIVPTMGTLGDAASALGASTSDINGVVRALGQISSKGRLQLEEINQIAEAFPGANPIPALAAAVNASVPDFTTALSKPGGALAEFGLTGQQAVAVILDSFKDIKGAAGAMDRQSKTLRGTLSTLSDTLRQVAIDSLKPFLPGISAAISKTIIPAVTKLGKVVPVAIGKVVDAFKPLAKSAGGALHAFASELDGVGKPTEGVFARLGDAVGRFLDLLKTLPGAFTAAFRTGNTTTAEGLVGVAERLGIAFGGAVDGIKAFATAFTTGKADVDASGFAGVMSTLGDSARDLVDWLKVKIPDAITAFNTAWDLVVPKVREFFDFLVANKDTLLLVTAGLGGFLVAIKELSVAKTVATSTASLIASLAGLGPGGVAIAGLLALAGAFTAAYVEIPGFQDAVKDVAKTFQEDGVSAGFEDAAKKITTFVDNLWDTVRPALGRFFDKASTFFQDKFADLFNFEVIKPDPSIDFPGTGFAGPPAAPLPASIDFPGTGFVSPPPPKQFTSFGEGFADSMMNTVIPAIGDWIITNKQKVFDQLDKLLGVILEWARKNGPRIANGIVASIGNFQATNIWAESKFITGMNLQILSALAASFIGVELELSPAFTLAEGAFDLIREPWNSFWKGLDEDFASWNEDINGAFGKVLTFITDTAPGLIAGAAKGLWHAVVDDLANIGIDTTAIGEAFGHITKWLTDTAPQAISDAASGMWDGITGAFRSAINAIIDVWNALNFTMPKVHIPGTDSDFGGWTIGGFHIDHVAGGAVFNREFTGMLNLAETARARPEIISPVSLMAETFRRELAHAPGHGGTVFTGDFNITEAQTAASVVDEIHARLGWMLTTRAER